MSFLTLWLLVLILERSIASKHRNVNLALETVIQFDKPDDINVIKKIQGFLSHIRVLLDKNHQTSSNVITRRKNKYLFTDFVEDLIIALNSFDDIDLKQVVRIVDKDFKTRKVDNDLIDDNVRRFVNLKLTEIRNQPSSNIRRDLDRILRELRAEKNSYYINFLNTLLKSHSERKLLKLIKRLNLFPKSARKTKIVLKSIIEKVIHDVLYEQYNNLKDTEKDYIKNFVKAYVIDNIPTNQIPEIKQRAKKSDIEQEITSTSNEKISESKPTNQVTPSQLTPETVKDVPIENTKKIFTHITLYPKTIKVKKIPTGLRTVEIIENSPTNEENKKNKRNEERIRESNEIFTNQSVEINVNLMLKDGQDFQNREDSQTVELVRAKSTPKNIFLRSFKNSIKNKNYHKSSSPVLSVETFGSLYRINTSKRYNNKITSKLVTYDDMATIEDRPLKSTYVDDGFKGGVLKKMNFVENRRRFNKLTNSNEDKVPESAMKDTVRTTTQHSLATRLIIPSDEVINSVVTTDKTTMKSTQKVIRNKIVDNENVTNFKEATKKPLLKRIRTNIDFDKLNNTTQFENDSNNNFNKKTTVTEVSMIPFDVNKFIKNSKVLNFKNDEKMKQIEDKMKADFEHLIGSPSTNATTEGYTDIFKELEDAFEITA